MIFKFNFPFVFLHLLFHEFFLDTTHFVQLKSPKHYENNLTFIKNNSSNRYGAKIRPVSCIFHRDFKVLFWLQLFKFESDNYLQNSMKALKQRLCIFSQKLSNENKQQLYKIQKPPTKSSRRQEKSEKRISEKTLFFSKNRILVRFL